MSILQPMSGRTDPRDARERKAFENWFSLLLVKQTGSCFERDVLRDSKGVLWARWIARAAEADRRLDELCAELNFACTLCGTRPCRCNP